MHVPVLSADGVVPGLSMDSGRLYGSPAPGSAGLYALVVTAQDPSGQSASASASLQVLSAQGSNPSAPVASDPCASAQSPCACLARVASRCGWNSPSSACQRNETTDCSECPAQASCDQGTGSSTAASSSFTSPAIPDASAVVGQPFLLDLTPYFPKRAQINLTGLPPGSGLAIAPGKGTLFTLFLTCVSVRCATPSV